MIIAKCQQQKTDVAVRNKSDLTIALHLEENASLQPRINNGEYRIQIRYVNSSTRRAQVQC